MRPQAHRWRARHSTFQGCYLGPSGCGLVALGTTDLLCKSATSDLSRGWVRNRVAFALRLFNYLRCGPEHTQQPKAKFRASMRDETRSLTTAPPPRRCSLPPRLEPTRHPSALRPLISPRTWPTPRPAPRACTTTARSPAGSPEIDLQWEMLACNYRVYGPISHCDVSDVTDVTSGARDCSRCAGDRSRCVTTSGSGERG